MGRDVPLCSWHECGLVVLVINEHRPIRGVSRDGIHTCQHFLLLATCEVIDGHAVATPADWKQGEDVIIALTVSDEDAQKRFPGYVTKKPYLRVTKQPQ